MPDEQPPPAEGRFTILNQAAIAVARNEDRYGAPEDCFSEIAEFWSLLFRDKLEAPLDALDVGRAMVALKLVRSMVSPDLPDHYVDGCGYFSILGELSRRLVKPDAGAE